MLLTKNSECPVISKSNNFPQISVMLFSNIQVQTIRTEPVVKYKTFGL